MKLEVGKDDSGRYFMQGWKHFLGKMNDAEAVKIMKEVPGKIEAAVKEAKRKIEKVKL